MEPAHNTGIFLLGKEGTLNVRHHSVSGHTTPEFLALLFPKPVRSKGEPLVPLLLVFSSGNVDQV